MNLEIFLSWNQSAADETEHHLRVEHNCKWVQFVILIFENVGVVKYLNTSLSSNQIFRKFSQIKKFHYYVQSANFKLIGFKIINFYKVEFLNGSTRDDLTRTRTRTVRVGRKYPWWTWTVHVDQKMPEVLIELQNGLIYKKWRIKGFYRLNFVKRKYFRFCLNRNHRE